MLFEPLAARSLNLKNRVVMSPMTRNRAVDANCLLYTSDAADE